MINRNRNNKNIDIDIPDSLTTHPVIKYDFYDSYIYVTILYYKYLNKMHISK